MSERPSKQFFRPDVRRDVDDEIAYHLELRAGELVERGALQGEAREAAARRFGNVSAIARECRAIDEAWYREQRRAGMWTDLRQDLRYAVRILAKARGFSAVAILTLALGIGGSTAIFSVIDAVLLRPLPYPAPEQLVEVRVEEPLRAGRTARLGPSLEDIRVWREDGQVFSHLATYRGTPRPEVLDGSEPARVVATEISEDYLGLFGVTPALGRGLVAEDMHVGAPAVALLGYGFWQRRFGKDPHIVGQTLRLDNVATTVVGVLPPSFYPESQVWRPFRTPPEFAALRGSGATTYGRLRPGISFEEAKQRLAALRPLRANGGIELLSLYDETTSHYWQTTSILALAVGCILLIACINAASLLQARGAARRPELGIRSSLGAVRTRLIRQLLAESVLLSVAGGLAGILLAWLALDTIVANIPLSMPENSLPTINLAVLGFAAALSLVTGILFGLAPALTLSRVQLAGVLSQAAQRHGSALSRRGGQTLIAAEVAVAIVLLAGAGLMIKSFSRMVAVDVGFDPDAVITMEVVPVTTDPSTIERYYVALAESLRQVPGVQAAGGVDQLPLGGIATKSVARVDGEAFPVDLRRFVPGYFEALGVPLADGRLPVAAELGGPLPAAVVNEQAARRLFPSGFALGRQIVVAKTTYQVVGVVGNVRHGGPLEAGESEVYLPHKGARPLIMVVRASGDDPATHAHLREAAQGLGTRVVLERIRRGSDWFGDRVLTPRRRTVLLGLLGGLGLVLTLVGVFGITAYAVGRRTQEIGVRMALGARPVEVVRAILADALLPVAAGVVIGLGAASLATRVIDSFLFETPPRDAWTFAAVALTMIVCAGVAAWVPARRAASVDPVAALRST